MKTALSLSLVLGLASDLALAQVGAADSVIWSDAKGGRIDGGRVVMFPTGSSDYFDATFTLSPGIVNTQDGDLASGLPVTGAAVSVTDFGSGRTYRQVGM